MKDTVPAAGIQLLSPSLQRGLRATTADYGNQLDDLRATSASASSSNPKKKQAAFDFDSFTVEAVRRRHDQHKKPTSSFSGSFLHATASSSGGSPRSPSLVRGSARFGKTASYDQLTSLENADTHSVRSADDYEWGNHRGTQSISTPSYAHSHSYSASVTSNGSSRYPVHNLSHLSMSSAGGLSKRMSMASSTTSSARPGMNSGDGSRRMKQRSEVVVRGWLQRRRGRVIKRWKAQYCVLKTDQKLCLYANEDTVNGRLEGRFQLLRVTYNDKNGSFQVIGIGSNETPYKEEFRPLDDDGWRAWFQALREFFDAASLHEALDKMPELSLVPGVHAMLLEDDEDESDEIGHRHGHNDDDDDDGGMFNSREVEEMIMRPYAFGSRSGSGSGGDHDRTSTSNASSSTTTTTTSSNNQQSHHHPPQQDHHHQHHNYRPSQLQNQNQNQNQNQHQIQNQHNNVPKAPLRRKTILFNNETMRYTTGYVPHSSDDHLAPDSVLSSGTADSSQRGQYASGSQSKASSIASTTSSNAESASDARLHHGPSGSIESSIAERSVSGNGVNGDGVTVVDCPMIERDSQNPMPILEGPRGSESAVSNSSDGAYSWNRL